jgi:hypothetical protein
VIVSMPIVGYSETTMKPITTTVARIIATTALHRSWAVLEVWPPLSRSVGLCR